jgi:ATP-dependent Clp protease protease subunit
LANLPEKVVLPEPCKPDIKITADHILDIKERLNNILAEATGQDLSVIERDTDRDNYMSAADAASYGLIDKVIDKH